MGKKILLIGLFAVALGGLAAALIIYSRIPKNAAEQLALAKEIEKENNLEITKVKTSGSKDKALIDELEQETDDAFQKVIDKYPNDPEAEEAEFHLIERAQKRGDLKGRKLIDRYEEFIKKFPKSEKIPDLMLEIAKVYNDDLKLPGEAINKYRDFIEKFPEHEKAPNALWEIAKIQRKLEEDEAAEKTYTEIIEKFPDHELAAEAQYERARLRSEKLDKEEEALEDFKEAEEKLPEGSPKQRAAQASRQELGQKQAAKEQQKAQDEYYGAQEQSYISNPPDDWNDPTVDVIRSQGVDTQNYDLSVSLDPDTHGLSADLQMRVKYTRKEPLTESFIVQFNGGLGLDTLTQNGQDVRYDQKGNFLHIALREPMRQGEEHEFHFVYSGNADRTWKGDAIDPKGCYLRPESRWYPYTSWGDEFTVTRIDIAVPTEWTAIGPGMLVEAENTVVIETIDGEKVTTVPDTAAGEAKPEAKESAKEEPAGKEEAAPAKKEEAAPSEGEAASEDEAEEVSEDAETTPEDEEASTETEAEEAADEMVVSAEEIAAEAAEAADKADGTHTFRWRSEEPIGLLALVANEFVMNEREARPGLIIQCYTYPEHEEFVDLYLDELGPILEFYEETLGEFPFKKMAVAEIPFFPGGYGSPSLLMITDMVFKESNRVVAEFLAHEVTHQWFGNLLGLDLTEDSHPWLSEAFATYIDALYVEHKDGKERFIERIRDMGGLYIESLVAFEDEPILEALWSSPMYRTLAYEKGGLVIHALRYTMGDEKFFSAMREYIRRYRHKIVTVTKFQEVMTEFHGEDLDWFFEQWLHGVGYPHYYLVEATTQVREFPSEPAEAAKDGSAKKDDAKTAEASGEPKPGEAAADAKGADEAAASDADASGEDEAAAASDEKASEGEASDENASKEEASGESASEEDEAASDEEAAASAEEAAEEPATVERWATSVTIHQLGDEIFKGFVEVRLYGEDEEEEVHSAKLWNEKDETIYEVVTDFQPVRAAIDPDAYIIKYPSMDDLERDVDIAEE